MSGTEGTLGPGSTFGGPDGARFLVEQEVGRGGQAVVFRVLDQRLSRPAALKVSTAAGPNRALNLERFEAELRLTSRVRHPHVLQVYDCGELPDGSPWVLLEWMGHGSVGQLIKRVRKAGRYLPLPHVRYYATAVAAALRATHAANLVHRDVKPDNVLVGRDGVAKLTDFGIAKDLSSDAEALTQVGHTLGTFGFMAPEQIRGMPGLQSDIFSWGATVYSMLAGMRPPQQEVNGFPIGLVEEDYLDPIPPCFRDVLAGALAANTSDRFATFSEVLAALHEIVMPDVDPRPITGPEDLPVLPSTAFMSGITDQVVRGETVSSRVPEPDATAATRTAMGISEPSELPSAAVEAATRGLPAASNRPSKGEEPEAAPAPRRAPTNLAAADSRTSAEDEPVEEAPPEPPRPVRAPRRIPADSETASAEIPTPGRSPIPLVAVLALVAAAIAAVALQGPPEPDPAAEVAAALAYGDGVATSARAPVAGPMPATASSRDGGHLVLAYDALVRGDWDTARSEARAVSAKDPKATAHARMVEAAAYRLGSPAGYVSAAPLYAEAAACSSCGAVAERAAVALLAACAVSDAPRCPAHSLSPRDREFVAASVLWSDSHTDAANTRLAAALALPVDAPSCVESQVLRGWKGAVPDLALARRAAARVPSDCEIR